MSQFRKILVYVQALPDARAGLLDQVIDLASRHGASVTLCAVVALPPGRADEHGVMEKLSTLAWRNAFTRLRSLAGDYRDRIRLQYVVLAGVPFLAITEQVVREGYDLVVHLGDALDDGRGLNPTAMHLVRKCPSAVWSLQPQARSQPRNVLLAVDRDLTGRNQRTESFSRELAGVAASMLHPEGVLHVLHAWQPFGQPLYDDPALGLSDPEISNFVVEQAQDHADWFDRLMAQIDAQTGDSQLCPHLVRGSVVSAITEVVDSADIELLVMGTIGTSTVPGVLIGMSAEAILSMTRIPILSLKPSGFESPLKFAVAPEALTETESLLQGDYTQ